jgi:hypothetical protein
MIYEMGNIKLIMTPAKLPRKTKCPPVYKIFSVKVWVFLNYVRNGWYFDIAFLKSGGAIEKLLIQKGLLLSQPQKSKGNFLSGFYWLRYD